MSNTIYTPGIRDTTKQLSAKGVQLVDRAIKQDLLTKVNLIIGVDNFHQYIMGARTIHGVHVIDTPGGVLIHGPLPSWARKDNSMDCGSEEVLSQSVIAAAIQVRPPPDLSQFWELESIGLAGETLTPNELRTQELVTHSITKSGNHYTVGLPFCSTLRPPPNFQVAKGQLDSLY